MAPENKLQVTLHDVLRAVVSSSAALLHDPAWIEAALEAIDRHEQAAQPQPQATEPEPTPAPAPEPPTDSAPPAAGPPPVAA